MRMTVLLLCVVLVAVGSVSVADSDGRLCLPVEEFALDNGMKFLVLERHRSPTMAAAIFFKVGSVNEDPGETGISHLLEHMMFKGTEWIGTKDYAREKPLLERLDGLAEDIERCSADNAERRESLRREFERLNRELREYVVKDEIWRVYMENGARSLNASTSQDITSYYCGLPSNRLSLWALIESERMKCPVFREFYSERDVVMEERRLGHDNSPRGAAYEELNATAFMAHPYRWPVLGWESDIRRISRRDIFEHFRTYYVPNNAVAVIVGDVKVADVRNVAGEYFGEIPGGADTPPVRTVEPRQRGERRVELAWRASPAILMAFHQPEAGHADQYVLDIIAAILSWGNMSRFESTLVREKKLAVWANASSNAAQFPSLFTIEVSPRLPHEMKEVEEAVYEELERLKMEPLSERELARVKNQMRAAFIRQLDSNFGLAWKLGYYEAIGSWRYVETLVERQEEVTPLEVMRVAKEYFTKENRSVVILGESPGGHGDTD